MSRNGMTDAMRTIFGPDCRGDDSQMQRLVGRTIYALYVEKSRDEYLRIYCDCGSLVWRAEGDCCSESWFADITGVEALLGATVTAVEEVELPDPEDNRTRQDCDQAYGFKITTTKGRTDIVFRNSSNGYYGGSLCAVENWNQHVPAIEWAQITEDWSA